MAEARRKEVLLPRHSQTKVETEDIGQRLFQNQALV